MFLRSNVTSVTGKWLYSDSHLWFHTVTYQDGEHTALGENRLPCLNRLAKVPVLGMLAGVFRIALSIIHIVGHLLAGIFTCDSNHFPHIVKGFAELLRGVIEAIPIIGNCFAWRMDPGSIKDSWSERAPEMYNSRFFLIYVYHPKKIAHNPIIQHYIEVGAFTKKQLETSCCITHCRTDF